MYYVYIYIYTHIHTYMSRCSFYFQATRLGRLSRDASLSEPPRTLDDYQAFAPRSRWLSVGRVGHPAVLTVCLSSLLLLFLLLWLLLSSSSSPSLLLFGDGSEPQDDEPQRLQACRWGCRWAMGVSASARHPRQDWRLAVHPGPADAIDDGVAHSQEGQCNIPNEDKEPRWHTGARQVEPCLASV